MLCNYGCKRKAVYKFKNGKWCCEKNTSSCPSMKSKNSELNSERIFSVDHRKNLSKSLTGRKRKPFTFKHKIKLSEAGKGRIPTKETRNKISKSLMGHAPTLIKHTDEGKRNISRAVSGKLNGMYGKTHSKELVEKWSKERSGSGNPMYGKKMSKLTREKQSIAKKGKFNGSDNPNWRGGISLEPYCFEFTNDLKEYIKNRDLYQCKNPDCWGRSKKLVVHHIDYDKKHCVPENLITLCISCNSRANFKRIQWKKIFLEIIGE